MKKMICLLLALVLTIGLLPVSAQAAQSKLIALTFDDGPDNNNTQVLLDGLRERGVKVTFFVLGDKSTLRPWLVEQAYDDGHEIGNHSWNHPHLTTLSFEEVEDQVQRTKSILEEICGVGTEFLMRPPYGDVDESIYEAINMPIIQWSIDSSDWATNEQYVYDFIMKTARDGRIILCHDTVKFTPRATMKAIDDLMAQGYEFVTVSELFRRRGMKLEPCKEYWYCYNQSVDLGAVQPPRVSCVRDGDMIRVTMDSPSGAPIHYTTDGSRITQESEVYDGSFLIFPGDEVRAVAAFKLNGGRSAEVRVTDAELKAAGVRCGDPAVSVEDGWMYLSCDDVLEPIYYTLDGSEPTEDSPCYTDPVEVAPGSVIRAVAGGDDWPVSREVMRYYSQNGNLFADVMPDLWYTDIMDQVVSSGLMVGVGGGYYLPDGELTRAMMAELLYRYAGAAAPILRTNVFSDISGGEWYANSVEWAYASGVVEGYPDGTFRPDQAITRQEMAEMIVGFLESQGVPLPESEDCRENFLDGDRIADWALDSFNIAVATGLMQGDPAGNLTPLATATRAQFATILLRMEACFPPDTGEQGPAEDDPALPPQESEVL